MARIGKPWLGRPRFSCLSSLSRDDRSRLWVRHFFSSRTAGALESVSSVVALGGCALANDVEYWPIWPIRLARRIPDMGIAGNARIIDGLAQSNIKYLIQIYSATANPLSQSICILSCPLSRRIARPQILRIASEVLPLRFPIVTKDIF